MGFDGLFFGRVDIQDYAHRNSTKTMEMIWKGSANLGGSSSEFCDEGVEFLSLGEQSWLFTGVLPKIYTPPTTFCFDFRCKDDPIMVC